MLKCDLAQQGLIHGENLASISTHVSGSSAQQVLNSAEVLEIKLFPFLTNLTKVADLRSLTLKCTDTPVTTHKQM